MLTPSAYLVSAAVTLPRQNATLANSVHLVPDSTL